VSEETKLLKAAEGYKGTRSIKEQLTREAYTDGYAPDIVNIVLRRLHNTEKHSTRKGNKLGVAHNPNKQYQTLSLFIRQLRGS
jgi:hypothetical protein